MSDFSNALSVSASGLRAQTQRLVHVSENIANADTPGYRRKTVAFETAFQGAGTPGIVTPGPVQLDRRELSQVYDPGHALATRPGNTTVPTSISSSRSRTRARPSAATRPISRCSSRPGKCRRA